MASQHEDKGNTLPVLGVGITYSSELDPILKPGLVDLIEIEPQTLWIRENGHYKMPPEVIGHLEQFPFQKLIHSVGLPVGGTFRGDPDQITLLIDNIKSFRAPWASEHLGFNATADFFTGFFLPPQQTEEGIERAVSSIRFLQDQLPVPFAVETGVNYLKPRRDEMTDGQFVAEVVNKAGCGLLLDLHNLYTNQLNGRQSIDEFLSQVPLDKIWEIHLAGGIEMDGFWLDAHSGNMPEALVRITEDVVQHLPNLKAIVYELLPSYLPVVGLSKIEAEMVTVRNIWEKRKKASTPPVRRDVLNNLINSLKTDSSSSVWEESLGSLAIGKELPEEPFHLSEDPGISVIRKLIQEFRASMLISVFKLTSRLIILALGADVFRAILADFWKKYPPQQFASDEALNFSVYLKGIGLKLPNLSDILDFEESTLKTLLDNQTRIISFDYDPFPLLRSLSDGKLETMERQKGNYEIEITGDYSSGDIWKAVMQNKLVSH